MSGTDVELPADDLALEELLRDRRFGPPMPYESTPWDFARKWGDSILHQRVWPIVSRLLVDDDELVRARAVELVRGWHEGAELTTRRLIEVAETHPELYADQAPEGTTLRYELAFSLSNRARPENGARVAAVLRELAVHEPVAGGAALLIARHDPAFIVARAKVWGEAQVRWFADAAGSIAMFRRDELLPVLHAFLGFGQASRERILGEVESFIERDDGDATSLAEGEKLPPPRKPAPTADECRRAIGL